jgi:light-regulated signal transduction histidine kinase (bacteriophytochrome)
VQHIEELGLYAGILTDITEVVNARSALAAAKESLEMRVAQRTQTLTEVNAELETFSYSLSHDMKAPLTRIESWANVLQEEYRSVLGEEGQKSILFLKREIASMHEMIRSMLSLAKASRADLVPVQIDVSRLAAAEFSLLREQYGGLNIEFSVEPGLQVFADLALFTSLLRNLLDNALKFSSKKAKIEIHVGRLENAESPVFYVRDNGDGFDMRFADRLFGPFQRMHTQKEFPGTGIGLATAQRIVHRHGGRIWVESQKTVGTTFFFTIPQANHSKDKISQ